jgi:hypothetical protein
MAEKKASAGRYKGIVALLLVFGPAFLLVFISTRGCEHKFKELGDFGPIPNYSFVDFNGKLYSNKDFKGEVVLFNTIQQTCPSDCAISMWHFDQLIYQHIRKNPKKLGHVKIVSFVTDGKGNPVEDLSTIRATLKDQIESYDSTIWILAKGDAKQVFNISHNGSSLLKKGKQYYGGEAYQELMLLSDKQNHLRMVLSGKSEGMIRRMKQHMALLDKQYDKLKAKKRK